MEVYHSNRKDKRFVAVFKNGKKTHFGLKNGSAYIDHKNKTLRTNYIKRHKVNENWENPFLAGTLSRYILWEKTKLTDAIQNYKRKFKSFWQ